MLRRFNPIFDYANERIILEPSKHFSEPFKFNMAGLAVTCADKGSLGIDRVVPDSPASEAGLKPGDVITEINHRPSSEFNLDRLSDALTEEGKELTLCISREGRVMEVTLGESRFSDDIKLV